MNMKIMKIKKKLKKNNYEKIFYLIKEQYIFIY